FLVLLEVYLYLVPAFTSPYIFDFARYFHYCFVSLFYSPFSKKPFSFYFIIYLVLNQCDNNNCKLVPLLIQLFTILYKVQFTYSQSTVTQGREKIPSLILS